MTCAVIVPVLNRPERVVPLVRSLYDSVKLGQATPYFVVGQHDRLEIEAIEEIGAPHFITSAPRTSGDYARKINLGIRMTEEPWIFLGADDLRFQQGWLDVALGYAEKYGRRVIGTNDLGNREVIAGRHSTHSLVARSYIEERGTADEVGKALHEGYDHQFVDNEFVETARSRGEFVQAQAAIVEHLHPHWGKAEPDDTYRLALAQTRSDRDLFRKRRSLWVSGRARVRAQRSAARARR